MATIDWLTTQSGIWDWNNPSNWSSDTVPGYYDTAVISASTGQDYTVELNLADEVSGAGTITLDQKRATLLVDNTAGGTATLNSTITLQAGTLALGDNATFGGTLDGEGGAVSIRGSDALLELFDNGTLNGVAITISSAGGDTLSVAADPNGGIYTIGRTTSLVQVGQNATLTTLYYDAYGPLFNVGTCVNDGVWGGTVPGGSLTIVGDVINDGSILLAHETITLGEDYIDIQGTLTNDGTIVLNECTLVVGPYFSISLSDLNSYKLLSGNALDLETDLGLGGGTLTFGGADHFSRGDLDGTSISDGTIVDPHGALQFTPGGGTLTGINYDGVLDLRNPFEGAAINGSTAFAGANGTGSGTINITGEGDTLLVDLSQDFVPSALNNVVINIGDESLNYDGTPIGPAALAALQDLQLGNTVIVKQAGLFADLGILPSNPFQGVTQSAATIEAGVAGGTLTTGGTSFTSTGTITVSNGDTVDFTAAQTTNAGILSIDAGSIAELDLYNFYTSFNIMTPFTNTGTIDLNGGRFTELTDHGSVPAVAMINEAGGQITGNGTLTAPITDDGLITAAGGALTIDGAITGTGEALAGPGATLTLTGAVGHKVTAGFAAGAAASGVLALSPLHFLGEITGFAAGDAIDLLNTNASAASFSGSALLITLTNGDTLTLALTAAQTGALTVTTGAHGDSLITFAGAAAAVIDRPASASAILPHASLPPDLAWLTAVSHAHPW